MLEDMKIDILHSLALQMDIMQLNMKREEVENALDFSYPRCGKKHKKNEFPLDTVKVCGIFTDKHPTDKCPLLSQ